MATFGPHYWFCQLIDVSPLQALLRVGHVSLVEYVAELVAKLGFHLWAAIARDAISAILSQGYFARLL